MNGAFSERVLAALADAGVAELCICPGGRNSPIVALLANSTGFHCRFFFDERSAAFFALGRSRATARPVAVITTSGTAAAELLPASIEAYYSGTPLVLVTADRPQRHRGTGAPQAIEQVGLFGPYAPTAFDGDASAEGPTLAAWDGVAPIHLNVCFDEPLVDEPERTARFTPAAAAPRERTVDTAPLDRFLAAHDRTLVVLGPLDARDHDAVRRFLLAYGRPVVAEAASGLREDPAIADLTLISGGRLLREHQPTAVLRIGGVPTLRLWRDLDLGLDVPVLSVSRVPFSGLPGSEIVCAPPGAVLDAVTPPTPSRAARAYVELLRPSDRDRAHAFEALLARHPTSEPALVRTLSEIIPEGALVYLGNSLPIREWDLVANRAPRGWSVGVNRGANGIDGQLSTFLGMCRAGRENWAVVGDLTALYDLQAPWALAGVDAECVRIVVLNNGGGRIFERMYTSETFQNPHAVGFEEWARMWQLPYERWTTVPATGPIAPRSVIELIPDRAATRAFWTARDRLDGA
ncbi:MAG TPA: 2-succinyl-5-enolpyruvyl-6-hydroxy-3-cyclohexene-1-carboxylic-acid synthase [Gemmatimonadales bacterium]|nr:2-succinyl-5-enolpyruvyl-6-hydroxy-3-cyclohexene-1-carboxylic-acid synthase [Gemmatimonadales bacterium]